MSIDIEFDNYKYKRKIRYNKKIESKRKKYSSSDDDETEKIGIKKLKRF